MCAHSWFRVGLVNLNESEGERRGRGPVQYSTVVTIDLCLFWLGDDALCCAVLSAHRHRHRGFEYPSCMCIPSPKYGRQRHHRSQHAAPHNRPPPWILPCCQHSKGHACSINSVNCSAPLPVSQREQTNAQLASCSFFVPVSPLFFL